MERTIACFDYTIFYRVKEFQVNLVKIYVTYLSVFTLVEQPKAFRSLVEHDGSQQQFAVQTDGRRAQLQPVKSLI